MRGKITFATIGDCCVDIYEEQHKFFLGGTAYNTAVQASLAGVKSSIFSAIGTDKYAKLFKNSFKKYHINASGVKQIKGRTSPIHIGLTKDLTPIFSNWELGVLSKYVLDKNDQEGLQRHDIARMVLFKPLIRLFEQFCTISLPRTLKAADFADTDLYSEDVKAIKKYIHSLDVIIKSLSKKDTGEFVFLKNLSMSYKDKLFLILLGEEGSIAFFNDKTYQQSALTAELFDTNGAGDAYIAQFLVQYFQTKNIQKAMFEATKAATDVISHLGASN